MRKKTFLFGIFFCLFAITVSAQTQTPEEKVCEPPFYTFKEVSEKVKIIRRPSLQTTEEFRKNLEKGDATLSAILCSTGKISKIQIIEGLPFGMNERLIEFISRIEFIPAQKEGKPVSYKQIFKFHFSTF